MSGHWTYAEERQLLLLNSHFVSRDGLQKWEWISSELEKRGYKRSGRSCATYLKGMRVEVYKESSSGESDDDSDSVDVNLVPNDDNSRPKAQRAAKIQAVKRLDSHARLAALPKSPVRACAANGQSAKARPHRSWTSSTAFKSLQPTSVSQTASKRPASSTCSLSKTTHDSDTDVSMYHSSDVESDSARTSSPQADYDFKTRELACVAKMITVVELCQELGTSKVLKPAQMEKEVKMVVDMQKAYKAYFNKWHYRASV